MYSGKHILALAAVAAALLLTGLLVWYGLFAAGRGTGEQEGTLVRRAGAYGLEISCPAFVTAPDSLVDEAGR